MNKLSYILCFIAVSVVGALTFVFGAPTINAAITQKAATTTAGLIGWWSFDEGTSTTAGDFSGRGNSATLTGGPTWTTGKRGRALTFDGSTTYAQVQGNSAMDSPTNLTMSAWVKLAGSQPSPTGITTKEQGDCTNSSYAFEIGGVVPNFTVEGVGNVRTAVDGSALPVGQWKLLTGVYDGSTIRIYIDGVFVNSTSHTAGIKSTTGSFQIGRQKMCSPVRFFNGGIDDVRLYNQAFSAAEVFALYKAGEVVRKTTDKTGLVGYWPFDEGTSTIAANFSGTTNNGTLLNFSFPPTATSGWTTLGKKGKALTFDGVDDYFIINQPSFQTVPNVFTMSGWINPDNQYARFLTPSTNGIDQWVGYDNTNQRLELTLTEIADVNNRSRYSTINSVPLNRWTHWAVSINDKDIKIYINGILDSSYTESINIGDWSGTWTIGQRGNATSYYKGKMDDLRVYNRILPATEIQNLYKSNQTLVNAPQDNKLTSGLVGYWTFNGKDVGTTIADVSGLGNHAYVQNVSTSSMLAIGKVGQGLTFNGTNSYVVTGSGPSNIATNRVTVSAWIYPNNTSSIMTVVSNDRDCGGCGSYMGYGMQIYYGGTSAFRIWNSDGTGPRTASTGTNPPANEWSFVTGTFDGTTVRYYMNGTLLGSNAAVGNGTIGTPASFATKIGQLGCCGGTHTMNGKIDEVRIYDRALSATEIKQLYLMGR